MKKKTFLKKITIFLCVLSVVGGMFGNTVSYYASDTSDSGLNYLLASKKEFLYGQNVELAGLPSAVGDDGYVIFYNPSSDNFVCYLASNSLQLVSSSSTSSGSVYYTYKFSNCKSNYYSTDDFGVTWKKEYSASTVAIFLLSFDEGDFRGYQYCYGSIPITYNDVIIFSGDEGLGGSGGGSASAELGYLQNLQYDTAYERGALYNYNEDSRTDRWKFDQYTTTEVDLTTVNYSVRHYIRPVLVKNYTDEGVIEEYEKYFMGEYDTSNLEFSYLRKDYDKKMEDAGYDGIGFIDAYLLGRFILEWHYFELVDNDTGAVGGYVLMKPTNSKGDFSFVTSGSDGCGYDATTYNPDGTIDENGYINQEVDRGMGGGLTIEEAFENADEDSERVNELFGIDMFSSSVTAYSSSSSPVASMFSTFVGVLPEWFIGLIALYFCVLFLLILIKVLRG